MRSLPARTVCAWIVLATLLLPCAAQDRYPVRLKLEPLSLRQRSGAPIAVQVKLEYNRPQIMQGSLVLELHDTINIVGNEDLAATIRFDDLVLAGTDYIFNAILPPLNAGGMSNLAVRAWFETESERIPLSSSLEVPVPPEPFDILIPGPMERFVLLCSASGRADYRLPSAERKYLNSALSLDQFNPQGPQSGVTVTSNGRPQRESQQRRIQNFSASWSARSLPEDPLSYCCFDMVLLADGALSRMSAPQMQGLADWVAAGGSLCVRPDSPLMRSHLGFLQQMLEASAPDTQMTLDDEGMLLLIRESDSPFVMADFGLGRVVLIDPLADLKSGFTRRQLGELNAWLWHVRSGIPVAFGQNWVIENVFESLRSQGVDIQTDAQGRTYIRNLRRHGTRVTYLSEADLRNRFGAQDRFSPSAQAIVDLAELHLMPADVQMVPTWVIGCILVGYVLAVGPFDYIVLGLFRARKWTWVLFPVVTVFFTVLTIGVAHEYMGSDDTGGSVTVTDVGPDGTALRQSRLEMLFYGARTTHREEHVLELVTKVGNLSSPQDYGASQFAITTDPLTFRGHFPQSYEVEQTVQQWSPKLLRTFRIAPEDVNVPEIDWDFVKAVTTADGRRRLALQIEEQAPKHVAVHAVVLNGEEIHHVTGTRTAADLYARNLSEDTLLIPQLRGGSTQLNPSADGMLQAILSATTCGLRSDYFGLVSQVSPQGSGTLEDLTIHDPDNEDEWVLVIVYTSENRYEVFRRRYTADEVVRVSQEETGGE